jgi:hypothetical protein
VEAGEVDHSMKRSFGRGSRDERDEFLTLLHPIAEQQPHAIVPGCQ